MTTILKRMLIAMAALTGVMCLNAGIAFGGTTTCPTQQCTYKPAVVHTTPGTAPTPGTPGTPSTTTTVTTSSTHVVIHSKVTENIRTYEKMTHKIVLVANKADGIKSSAGCMDPVARGLIPVGGNFDNSGGNHSGYWTGHWVKGQKICGFHKTQIDGQLVFVGFKNNCKNRIRIWVGQHTFKKYIPIFEVRSTRSFEKIYEKWVTSQKTTKTVVIPGSGGTPGTAGTPGTTTYSCTELGSGWVPVDGNPSQCKNCPPPPSCPPPTTPPSVVITAITTLNDVPQGKTSGPMPFTVYASTAGSVTVDPGNGGISSCSSNTPLVSITFNLSSGNNSLCVIFYAPGESSVNSSTITYTAIVPGAMDVKTQTFAITHPVRT